MAKENRMTAEDMSAQFPKSKKSAECVEKCAYWSPGFDPCGGICQLQRDKTLAEGKKFNG